MNKANATITSIVYQMLANLPVQIVSLIFHKNRTIKYFLINPDRDRKIITLR